MNEAKAAKFCFGLSAFILAVGLFVWGFWGTIFGQNLRLIFSSITFLIVIGFLITSFRYVDKHKGKKVKSDEKQYIVIESKEKQIERQQKNQELIISLKGLIAKAEQIILEYEQNREIISSPDFNTSLYGIYKGKAIDWQQEVESFITANFPEYYFNTLKFDQLYNPGGIRSKIEILEKEIEKLEAV